MNSEEDDNNTRQGGHGFIHPSPPCYLRVPVSKAW
jgi:hypothetical protein